MRRGDAGARARGVTRASDDEDDNNDFSSAATWPDAGYAMANNSSRLCNHA